MVISKQGGVQLVRWSYRSKSGWVWLIPLSSPNDAAVEESSSKMRLFQKFSRCGWCWKFFKDVAVPEVLSKVRMMAESSSKTRLFQKFSRRCEWCWKCSPWRLYRYADCLFLQVAAVWMDLLYVEMCVESSFKGVVRLVLDAWCGYGEFLFNLQPCGYLWRGMKSQCMVRLLQCMVRLPPLSFLMVFLTSQNGAAAPSHLQKKWPCSSLRGRLHLFLSFNGAATPCTPLPTERTNSFQTTSLYFFLGAVVDLLFSSPVTVMEDTLGKVPLSDLFPLFLNAKIFSFFPGAAALPSRESFPPQWSRWLYQYGKNPSPV